MEANLDDRALVLAIRAGRTELFAELVRRHAPAVFRIVRAAIRHGADAEDVAQETFLAAYRALDRLRDPRRFRALLVTIASRKVVDHLRRNKTRARFVELSEEPPATPAPIEGEAAELWAKVEGVVARLDPSSRLIFALRHHEGLSCVQIARQLDLKDGTVYSRISRMHAEIRRVLEVAE
ncbi:MAG: RNA polymerase sigma factor [Planctomycetota bacterium]